MTERAGGGAGLAPTLSPLAPAGALELEFHRLQAATSDVRDRQQQLDERLFRASITASSVMDERNIQVSVLDPAYLPDRPISKPRSLLLAGLLAGWRVGASLRDPQRCRGLLKARSAIWHRNR